MKSNAEWKNLCGAELELFPVKINLCALVGTSGQLAE